MKEEDSSAIPFLLPSRYRLRSSTVRTLSQILSHFAADDSSVPPQIASERQKPRKDPNFFNRSPNFPSNEPSRNRNENLDCHGVTAAENPLLEKDRVEDENTKSIDARKGVFGGGCDIFGRELVWREGLDGSGKFEKLYVEKEPIADESPMEIEKGSPIDENFGLLTRGEGNGELGHSDKVDSDNLSIGTGRIVDENAKFKDSQNVVCAGSLTDWESGEMVGEESRVGFSGSDSVELKILMVGELKLEEFPMEKDPIREGSAVPIHNLDVGSCLGESFVDGGLEKEVHKEGGNGFVDCNAAIGRGPIANGSPKLNDAQGKNLTGQGSSIDWELDQVMQQHKGSEESVDIDKLEFERLSMEKDLIMDGNHISRHTQDGLNCGGRSPIDGRFGQIVGPEGSGESVYCGNVELEKLLTEKGLSTDEMPKSTNTEGGYFCDGKKLVSGELGHVTRQEERQELVACSDLEVEKLSVENAPVADGSLESVNLEQRTQQQEHDGFIDHNSLKSSISSLQKDLIVGNICTSFDTQDGYNGSEPNDRERTQHELHQEEHELNALYSSDTSANSSRTRNRGEVDVIDNVNDFSALTADEEMEDGEIPTDLDVLMEPNNSIFEHVVCEERQEKGQISDSFDEQGEDFAYTCKEKLKVDKKDMLHSSYLTGSSIFTENSIGGNFKAKETKGNKDKSKKRSSSKTDKVNCAFGNENIQTSKTEARNNRVKGDTIGELDASDCFGFAEEVSEKIGDQVQEKISTAKDAKLTEKKKRNPPGAERKSKRKLAKKRKRAEQNKKLGVKRLKLQPILKPKVVSDCKYHLQGKCHKGDKCKFLHDAVPLTKSQPCTHFARQSCLKGDDCPFDHQLSKYPCCKYTSWGFCRRGDACLFSHQMPIAEGSTGASNIRNPETPLLPPKTNSEKQQNISGTSHLAVNHILNGTSLSTPSRMQSLLPKDPKQHMAGVRPKPPAQAPEGLRFLSFAEAPLDDTNKKQQENLPANKCRSIEMSNQQKQTEFKELVKIDEMPCRSLDSSLSSSQSLASYSCGSKNSSTLAQKAYSSMPTFVGKLGKSKSNNMAKQSLHAPLSAHSGNILGSNKSSSEFATQLRAEKSQNRSTDASRILEEFLFSGIN